MAEWKRRSQRNKKARLRYIGFTGHKSPEIHLKMLNTAFAHKFTLNSVQMPLNLMDAHYDSFEKLVLPVLLAHNIGVLGMKPMGDGLILQTKTVEAVDCLRYALNLPTSVVITGCDSLPILQQALQTARTFRPLSQEQVAALLSENRKSCAERRARAIQNRPQFRRHNSKSAVARLN